MLKAQAARVKDGCFGHVRGGELANRSTAGNAVSLEVGEDGRSMDSEQLDETSDRIPLLIRGEQAVDVDGLETAEKFWMIWIEPQLGFDGGLRRSFSGENVLVKHPNKGAARV